jgi:transposase
MARPYSEDLRERIVRAVETGMSRNKVAKQFDVSISCVVKLMQRWNRQGTVKADRLGGWRKPVLGPHEERIRSLVAAHRDITLKELCEALALAGVVTKRSTLADFLKRLGLNRKKRQRTPPSRSGRTSPLPAPPGARRSPA